MNAKFRFQFKTKMYTMKMKQLLLLIGLSLLSAITKINAQATVASNTLSTETPIANYLGSANDVNVLFKRNNVFAGMLSIYSTSLGVNSFAPAWAYNTSIGNNAGNNSTGHSNTFLGASAGMNCSGNDNIGIGLNAGAGSSGSQNIFIGTDSGLANGAGTNNVCLGFQAGHEMAGSGNVIIGAGSGFSSEESGSNNVFIGQYAGANEPGKSNKLCINNGTASKDLIWGDFAASQLKFHGKVGIGGDKTTAFGNFPSTAGSINISNYSLFVKGGILAEEVRVTLQSTWADYVFLKGYKLPTLEEVEAQINEKGHLHNVPSAKEIKENGIDLAEMSKIQQEKIEELTLYLIEQNKINKAQSKEISELKAILKTILEKK